LKAKLSKVGQQSGTAAATPPPTTTQTNASNNSYNRKSPVTIPSRRSSTHMSQGKAEKERDLLPATSDEVSGSFDDLPSDYKSVAIDAMITFVHDIVCSNPLAGNIPENMLRSASKEVAKQLKPLIGPLLWFTINKERENRKSLPVESVNELIFDDVTKGMSNPNGTYVAAVLNFILQYKCKYLIP
jgi:hypothetical protein